jgi:CDP-diacylglycerol--glycerol-3-phosphate 3-phosphatidyltransferase
MSPLKPPQPAFYLINGITLYRIVTVPLLLVLLLTGRWEWFKWLLAISFFTDLIDGVLARKLKVSSAFGSVLDSIGDDLTVLTAVVSMLVRFPDFLGGHWLLIAVLLLLFVIQVALAVIRYGKISSFHTYGAKVAAFAQGVFLLSCFFFPPP